MTSVKDAVRTNLFSTYLRKLYDALQLRNLYDSLHSLCLELFANGHKDAFCSYQEIA